MTEQKVDLNTAGAGELMQLSGIGPALADRIIRHRDAVGSFQVPIEITAVRGIGAKTFHALGDQSTVSETTTTGADEMIDEAHALGEMEMPTLHSAPVEPESLGTAPPEAPSSQQPDPASLARAPLGPDLPQESEIEPEMPPAARPASASSPQAGRQANRFTWPGCGGLVVAALAGALLGAMLALLVIGGINGTLDIRQSEVVLDIQADVQHLDTQTDALRTDVDGLRRRLDRLENLTVRMDAVEQSVDGIETAVDQAQTEIDALGDRAEQLSAEVAAVRAASERFDTFLDGLRDLLLEFQGPPPAPTPTPSATPTSRPSPTPTGTPWASLTASYGRGTGSRSRGQY